MDRLESFELEGVRYAQQYRKCSKPNCQTCSNGGPGHGPYWYARNQMTGDRAYVGRELPPEVDGARQTLASQAPELAMQRDRLADQVAALSRLLRREHLSSKDCELIDRLGFGACLVGRPAAAPTQDAWPAPSSSGLLVDLF